MLPRHGDDMVMPAVLDGLPQGVPFESFGEA